MTQTKPYQRPPMTPAQALAIARYAILAAIDTELTTGKTAAFNDLTEAAQIIEGLKQAYTQPKEAQCQP